MGTFEKETFRKKISKSTFGRKDLTVSYAKSELNQETMLDILKDVMIDHFNNVEEINYLKGYYRGIQEILNKLKLVRPDINNIVVENNAFHVIEFKKGYVFGDPIQYVQRSDTNKEELEYFNGYMYENDKAAKDKDLAEDFYISGVGYRFVLPSQSEDTPFEIHNADNTNAFIVHANDIQKTKLIGGYLTYLGDKKFRIMCYTDKLVYYYLLTMKGRTQKDLKIEFERVEINPLGQIPLFEYKLNKSKIGLIELVKGMLDALNTITSADLDDIEQFVQSLLVFINQEVDKETLTALLEIGALQIASKDPRNPADVKLLTNKMQHSETKVLYDRIYGNMLTIVGVPKMSDKASSGDTGQARLIGEGWTMADERAKQDELAFKQTERQVLKLALDICKKKAKSQIKNLKAKEIEIKFTRNRSDNMLVKTQALTNLKTAKVAPEVAFTVVGLFSDPTEVVNQSKAYFGEDFWMKEEVESENNVDNGVESSIVETI